MTKLDDETLVAYVDGELDPVRSAQVRAKLSDDPQARKRLHALRESARALSGVFDAPIHQPVPERLLAAVGVDSPATFVRGRRLRWLALAAGLAMLLGFGAAYIGVMLAQTEALNPSDKVYRVTDNVLNQALDNTLSGATFYWPTPAKAARQISPLASFKKHDDRYCREFEQSVTDAKQVFETVAVACRSASGVWRISVLMAKAIAAASTVSGSRQKQSFSPAAGNEMAVYDRVVADLMATPPLGPKREQELISNGWLR